MTGRIIYCPNSGVSARLLAETLGWKAFEFGSSYDNTLLLPSDEVTLFYGVSETIIPCTGKVLNRPEFVALNKDKMGSLEFLYNAGINVPAFVPKTQVHNELLKGTLKLPLIARAKNHANGSGLWVVLQDSDIDVVIRWGATHFLEHIKIKDEYRVYAYKGVLFKTVKKEATNSTRMDLINRSNDYGWKWIDCPSPPQCVIDEAQKAATMSWLDVCSIDIAENVQGNAVVFELNTASWLSRETAQKLAALIKKDLEPVSSNENIINQDLPLPLE